AKTVALKDFDEETSVQFLAKLGIVQTELAATIRRHVGGNPLTLRLAATVFRTEGGDPSLFKLAAADRENIQGQLFARILRHVHDEDVRKIAHPGLVLRRVTPEIIREVLAGPCELDVPDEKRARELFEQLAREVALVSAAEPGVVEHRSDVRRLMLRSLHETEPVKVVAIHRAAVDYYHRFDDSLARAEEIYHLLWLQERDQAKERYAPEAKPFLLGAMEELALPEQAFLADLVGDDLPPDARASATLEIWERAAERRVDEYLRNGDAKSALAVLSEEPRRSTATLLRVREAAVYVELNQLDKAEVALRNAPAEYTLARNWLGAFESLMLLARMAASRGDHEAAAKFHADAEELARGRGNELWLVRVLVERAPRENAASELIDAARAVDDEAWLHEPSLLRRVAGLVGPQDIDLVAKAARLAGGYVLDSDDERQLEEVLAAQIRGLESAAEIEPIWGRIQRAFDSRDRNFLTLLATVLAAVFRGEAASGGTSAQPKRTDGPKLKADLPALAKLLAEAGLEPTQLGDVLVRQFDRNLASLTFETGRAAMFLDVLRLADREGWLARLLSALRPIAPEGAALLRHLDGLGVGVRVEYAGGPAMREDKLAEVRAANRTAIGAIEHRICRIEVKGKFRGTGFLVGPTAVLTAAPTVLPKDTDVAVRFDYGAIGGKAYSDGVSCSVAGQWPLAGSPAVLLELVRAVANEPVGGPSASRFAPVRRMFDLAAPPPLARTSPLFWFWHTEKDGLHMTGSAELTVTETSISMYANDRARFAGSPCFDGDFRLVAIHCGADPNRRREGYALRGGAVAAMIAESGVEQLIHRGAIQLTGRELRELRIAILESFSRNELEMLLYDALDLSLGNITSDASSLEKVVFDVLQYAQQRDRIPELLAAMVAARPHMPRLTDLAHRHAAR
ncbi:MAG TPA: effector-associated domain EAD1-containing protein, partial [Thermoanaerobaculia bacterium]|nr:effector-associated domain EAD1-containing protein [Thermoanaerobaculia bacterium]